MAYQKNTWIARTGTNLNRFLDQNDNELILTPAPSEIHQQGTPFSADWMNNLEDGVEAASNAIDTHEDNTTVHIPSNGILPLSKGGTGASSAATARSNLGAASSTHTHALTSSSLTGTLPVSKGGTGATSTTQALKDFGLKSGQVFISVPQGSVRNGEVITFDEPYPNTDYVIALSVYSGIAGGQEGRTVTYTGKSATGFELRMGLNNASSTQDNNATCGWMTMPLLQEE